MIPISYDNVMNGLNKGIDMRLLCPSRAVTDYLFRRGCELWHIENFSQITRNPNVISYGSVRIRFDNFEAIYNDSWRGFRGIFMLHPDLTPNTIMPRFQNMLDEMTYHNERYMDSWRL